MIKKKNILYIIIYENKNKDNMYNMNVIYMHRYRVMQECAKYFPGDVQKGEFCRITSQYPIE